MDIHKNLLRPTRLQIVDKGPKSDRGSPPRDVQNNGRRRITLELHPPDRLPVTEFEQLLQVFQMEDIVYRVPGK
eukprot:CAMPEP_0184750134 /NCGR_PEP_ID=MMETSP0315-20130426/33574_1 /TAXON_ID=101924 /ORGANISM="Rhodosorus marinus, Strain UTEX LB 2760" /LENGTH=73 /DNA_ID=CAMNT_0027227915 /DNA_START=164 /DNA_END=385 /DNA_ORIENTATION=+